MTSGTTADGWSAYDEAVPHVTGLPEVVQRAADLRALRGPPAADPLAAVRQVVVVVASSRGGSTLFGELLRRTPGLLHLRAEVNPLYALAGLHAGARRRRVLAEELRLDAGRPALPGPVRPAERPRLVLDLAWRLVVQWPEVAAALPSESVVAVADAVVARPGDEHDPAATALRLVGALHDAGFDADPWYYDVPADRVRAVFGDLPVPAGPPPGARVEMAPFVAIDRWQPATDDELAEQPLVVSAPRCSFRLEHLRDLFPAAEMRVVHLARNPAASTNGLVDGWLHRGFANVPIPGGLRVPGYSDVVPGGDRWWCYDIPPGWEDWTDRPLAEVCAFQWRATHQAALDAIDRMGVDHVRLRFEDVVGPAEVRRPALERLESWLRLPAGALVAEADAGLPVVMATAEPAPRRWERRATEVGPGAVGPEVLDLAETLGYRRDGADWD